MTSPNRDSLKKQDDFERFMRLAHLNRRRGDYAQANQSIMKALEINPADLEAREFAADMLLVHGELQKALDAYKAILEEDETRASAEEKFAKITLQLAEGKRQQELLKDILENPELRSSLVPSRNPFVAAFFSCIPGFGHVYCGEYIKGVVIFGITFFSWFMFFLLRPSVYGSESQRIVQFVNNIDPLTVVFLLLAVVVHMYGIVNAAVVAEKTGKDDTGLT